MKWNYLVFLPLLHFEQSKAPKPKYQFKYLVGCRKVVQSKGHLEGAPVNQYGNQVKNTFMQFAICWWCPGDVDGIFMKTMMIIDHQNNHCHHDHDHHCVYRRLGSKAVHHDDHHSNHHHNHDQHDDHDSVYRRLGCAPWWSWLWSWWSWWSTWWSWLCVQEVRVCTRNFLFDRRRDQRRIESLPLYHHPHHHYRHHCLHHQYHLPNECGHHWNHHFCMMKTIFPSLWHQIWVVGFVNVFLYKNYEDVERSSVSFMMMMRMIVIWEGL